MGDYGREVLREHIYQRLVEADDDETQISLNHIDGVVITTITQYLNRAGVETKERLKSDSPLTWLLYIHLGTVKDMRLRFKQEIEGGTYDYIATMLAYTAAAIVEEDVKGKAVADEILAEANAKVEEEAE